MSVCRRNTSPCHLTFQALYLLIVVAGGMMRLRCSGLRSQALSFSLPPKRRADTVPRREALPIAVRQPTALQDGGAQPDQPASTAATASSQRGRSRSRSGSRSTASSGSTSSFSSSSRSTSGSRGSGSRDRSVEGEAALRLPRQQQEAGAMGNSVGATERNPTAAGERKQASVEAGAAGTALSQNVQDAAINAGLVGAQGNGAEPLSATEVASALGSGEPESLEGLEAQLQAMMSRKRSRMTPASAQSPRPAGPAKAARTEGNEGDTLPDVGGAAAVGTPWWAPQEPEAHGAGKVAESAAGTDEQPWLKVSVEEGSTWDNVCRPFCQCAHAVPAALWESCDAQSPRPPIRFSPCCISHGAPVGSLLFCEQACGTCCHVLFRRLRSQHGTLLSKVV